MYHQKAKRKHRSMTQTIEEKMKSTHIYRVEVETITGWRPVADKASRQEAKKVLARCTVEEPRKQFRIVYGRTEWQLVEQEVAS